MNDTQVEWIGSSCGRHGSYTFYKGFKINSLEKEKSYCLGEFYFVRNSEDRPICIAELQLIWHDASNDSKLASARLYFKPENTPFGRQSIHGKDELLYADQKVIVKCEDMAQWECSGTSWTTGLIPTLETDFLPIKDLCIDKFTGKPENKYRLQNTPRDNTDNTTTEKIIILTFQAYCRYIALQKRLLTGITIAKSQIASLGGIFAPSISTKIVFCRESFSCPDVDSFHLSGEHKAPVLKGRPRKKKIRSSTLAKELKRKRFLADLERVKKNLPSKKMKLSESEEGTESDLSEESTKSYESMDEDKPCVTVETPLNKIKQPNGFLSMKIKQVTKVINISEKDLKNTIPPPLIPTCKVKLVPASPPPLQKVKIQTESSVIPKVDAGPPPLYPAMQKIESVKKTSQSVPRLLPRVDVPASNRMQGNGISPASSKAYTAIKSSIGLASSSTSPATGTKPEISSCNSIKSVEPLCIVGKQTLADGKPSRVQPSDDMKMVGKENQQDSNKTDVIKIKKKRLRQPCNIKELNEEFANEEEKYFMRSLRDFMKSRDTPISKIPALGFKRVNLWTMYNTAQKLGGYDMVTSKRLWRQVYDALGGSTTITSAATYTRRHYERLLLPYESYVRSQLNNKKGLPEQTQHPNTSSSQDNTPKAHPINNNNQSGTTTSNEKNTVTKDNKISSSHDNQRPTPTDSRTIPATPSKNNSTLATVKASHNNTPVDVIKQSRSPKVTTPVTTPSKLLINNINTSRQSTSNSVVKIKPNGVITPYSVSVQNIKKEAVKSSFVIVTKSIKDASSSSTLIRSSTSAMPKTSSASTVITKLDTHGSSNVIQRGTTVTPSMTTHETSSHSSCTIINKTPVKNTATDTHPSSIKHEAVQIVQVQNPQKQSSGPHQQVSVTSPKIYVPQKQSCQSNTSKENVDHHGMSVNYITKSGHPVANEERRKITQEKTYEPEKKSTEASRIVVHNSLNHKRELKHVGEPVYQDHTPHHQSNARDSRSYDVSSQQNIGKSSTKRIAQNDFVASEEMKKKISVQTSPHGVVCHSQGEPMAKRRKTPSPAMTKVTPQPLDVIQTQSRSTCHLAYSQSDAIYSSHHTIKSNDDGCSKLYNTHASFNQGIQVNERKASHLEQRPVKQANFQRAVVDLTESSVVNTTTCNPIAYQKPSKSPSYTRTTHIKPQYLVEDSCQRTEPRLYGNLHSTRVNQSKDLTTSVSHSEDNQAKDSHLLRAHYKETYPSPQQNYRLLEEVRLPIGVERTQSKANLEQTQMNSEVHPNITHRSFTESPDEHFQEWRRRQGMTQYPAYISLNQNEQPRRSSMTEQPSPLESRYMYVQDDGALHPRVIEEVPLILSSKPSMYYQDESFYSGVPFYHGGWTTAGVADGVSFKGDPETINSNNHLRSSSCIFMPTSQMFGSAVPIAPLSPPVLSQGHVVSGQETISIHPHLLMTSPYSHNHQMVSQNPTRPLHSYT